VRWIRRKGRFKPEMKERWGNKYQLSLIDPGRLKVVTAHVDLENFATASRRYPGDIHNSSVVGLFMTPIGQWKRLDSIMAECTCLLHIASL